MTSPTASFMLVITTQIFPRHLLQGNRRLMIQRISLLLKCDEQEEPVTEFHQNCIKICSM
jgi:hypothetical protein